MPRRLSDYAEFLLALHQSIIEKTEFSSNPPMYEIMKEPRLVVAINHATPLSWLPAMSTLALEAGQTGGGDRIPMGVVDRWFYSNPLTQFAAGYFSNSRLPQSFDELLADFSKAERKDLIVFPEGANTFFGDVHDVHEFRSSRFVEMAIRARCPILIVAHKGSEGWSFPFQVPPEWIAYIMPFSKFFGEGLLKAKAINFPAIPWKIPVFQMKCELYWPRLQESDLLPDIESCKAQIHEEAKQVRQMMSDLLK
jgi:hypothetical protein